MAESVKMRRVLKRVGIVTCAAILAPAIVSIWHLFFYRVNSYWIGLGDGIVWFKTLDGTPSDVRKLNISEGWPMGWSFYVGTWRTAQPFRWPRTGHYEFSRTQKFDRLLGEPDNGLQGTVISTTYYLPLWVPFVAAGIPTLFFIWRDRRRRDPGRCVMCDYDLTGNVSGRCPECGTSCSLRSLWPMRLRRLIGCFRPGFAATVLLLGGGLWFYTIVPSPPRIIVAIGFDGDAHLFTLLRQHKANFLSRLSPLARSRNWDGESWAAPRLLYKKVQSPAPGGLVDLVDRATKNKDLRLSWLM